MSLVKLQSKSQPISFIDESRKQLRRRTALKTTEEEEEEATVRLADANGVGVDFEPDGVVT